MTTKEQTDAADDIYIEMKSRYKTSLIVGFIGYAIISKVNNCYIYNGYRYGSGLLHVSGTVHHKGNENSGGRNNIIKPPVVMC